MSSGADDLCTDTCQYTGALEVLSPIWWGAGSKIESSQVDLARKKNQLPLAVERKKSKP